MADCIFCRIAGGGIPAAVVGRTPGAVAFRDLNPQAPTHVLVIPETHVANARDTGSSPKGGDGIWAAVMGLAVRVADELGLDGGYRLVVNCGSDGGQSVDHLHVHLLGGRRLTWPPG